MPPALRNHRPPTAGDTPASIAASSVERPAAIDAQNLWWCSRRAAGGRPGDLNGTRPHRSERRLRLAIAFLLCGVLRRPFEFTQYASHEYQELLEQHGIRCSMSRKANCWDNAVAESFFATLKLELVYHTRWGTKADARSAIFEYIEVFYNRQRRHSALGYLCPDEFEHKHYQLNQLTTA